MTRISRMWAKTRGGHRVPFVLVLLFLFPLHVGAEPTPVEVRVPEPAAWVGQRVPFFVDLRAQGSFSGAAGFSLPDVSRSVILKVGNPVVSSEEIEGESWFIQSHEFALFSQQSGQLEIPSFEVRFESRNGFTGPVAETKTMVPAASFEIRRPPGTEGLGFLVTTESLGLSESWDPVPHSVEAGAVFKRTIVQRASEMTGMALAAAPTGAPDGVRVYPGTPEVTDNTARGAFLGERRETISYLFQQPGTMELPALTYQWWNPVLEELQSKTLPSVTVVVTPAPQKEAEADGEEESVRWLLLLAAAATVALAAWGRKPATKWMLKRWRSIRTPERIAAGKLLRACRRGEATAAYAAWSAWRSTQASDNEPAPELAAAALDLQHHLFGSATNSSAWSGVELARTFRLQRAGGSASRPTHRSKKIPQLNP